MMKSVITCQLSLLLALFLAACTGRPTADAGLENMALRHATNLTCQRGEGYSLWTLRNPWDTTATLHRYLLVHQETDATSIAAALSLGQGVSTIKVPVRKAGVATAVHCGLLDELGVAEAIAGVCEKQYIDLPAVTRGLEAGTIADFGNGMHPRSIFHLSNICASVLPSFLAIDRNGSAGIRQLMKSMSGEYPMTAMP